MLQPTGSSPALIPLDHGETGVSHGGTTIDDDVLTSDGSAHCKHPNCVRAVLAGKNSISTISISSSRYLTSTVASLFSFVPSLAASRFSSLNCIPQSVKIKPGLTQLTLMSGAQIVAKALLRCINAAFVTEYGRLEPDGFTPARDAVEMKAPLCFANSDRPAWHSQRCDCTL